MIWREWLVVRWIETVIVAAHSSSHGAILTAKLAQHVPSVINRRAMKFRVARVKSCFQLGKAEFEFV